MVARANAGLKRRRGVAPVPAGVSESQERPKEGRMDDS